MTKYNVSVWINKILDAWFLLFFFSNTGLINKHVNDTRKNNRFKGTESVRFNPVVQHVVRHVVFLYLI